MHVILLTQHARRSENLVVKKIICFLPSSYFSATQQGVGTDEAKTNSLASCKTTHLPTNCLYLELFILFSSACSKQSKQYCRVFEQKRYLSLYTLNPTVTRRNYTAHVPLAPYTCSDIRTHRMHTPCVLYTTPARTARANRAHRTRTPRAPYAHNARTVRTPRTHTPHAPYAHPARTHRTHTPHAPCAPLLVPER